jgi:phosphatidylglycerophosphate synthase
VGRYLNPANAITASRFLTLPPFVVYMQEGKPQLMTLMIIICGVLDLFDGPVARKFKCTSGFGEMFDAATDAFCLGFFIVVLTIGGYLPIVPMIVYLVLGVFNAGMRAYYTRRVGRTTNYRSFAMERMVAFCAYLTGVAVARIEVPFLAWAMVILMVIIVVHDFKRMILDPVPA